MRVVRSGLVDLGLLGLLPCECVKGVGTTLKTAPNAVFCHLSPDSTPYAVTCWLGDEKTRLAMRDASLEAERLEWLRISGSRSASGTTSFCG